jgi:hypothetical protein
MQFFISYVQDLHCLIIFNRLRVYFDFVHKETNLIHLKQLTIISPNTTLLEYETGDDGFQE